MSLQTIEGIVKNGQIVIPPGTALPESASVLIVVKNGNRDSIHMRSPRLVDRDRVVDFEMEMIGEEAGE